MKSFTRLSTLATALLAGTLVLAACGGSSHDMADMDDMGMASPSSTTGASAQDAMFAQMMIPHHQQAVEMATLAETRAEAPEIKELAAEIKSAQQPEIDEMTGWLEEWGMPVMSGSDAMGAHGGHGMSGMLTDEQMEQLEAATGAEFDRLFAEGMIEHHKGAIDMAEDVVDSKDPRVAALAQAIITTQQAEIAQLQEFLDRQGNVAEGDASASPSSVALDPALDHAHAAIAVEGGLLIGTHTGVVSVDLASGTTTRVGSSQDDFMGLASDGGLLIASGHPGEGSSLPDPVGLIRSDNGGSSWQSVSLTGEIDFHALAIEGQRIAGSSTTGELLASEDAGRTWSSVGATDATSLAWMDGRLWIAGGDGLAVWTPGSAPRDAGVGRVLLVAAAQDGSALWALTSDGTLQRTTDGTTWRPQGAVDEASAMAATSDVAYVVTAARVYAVPAVD